MSEQRRSPRRPAMLDPEDAEYIIGDEDPADGSALAHTSAWALLGVGDEDFGPEAVARLRETIEREGVDVVADMWSRSPEFTLPGALWRIYLFAQWVHRDGDDVTARYAEGAKAVAASGNQNMATPPDLTAVVDDIDKVMAGDATDDDLGGILEGASRAMIVLAAAAAQGPQWITDENDTLAFPVTVRPAALLETARELDEAARQASAGTLN